MAAPSWEEIEQTPEFQQASPEERLLVLDSWHKDLYAEAPPGLPASEYAALDGFVAQKASEYSRSGNFGELIGRALARGYQQYLMSEEVLALIKDPTDRDSIEGLRNSFQTISTTPPSEEFSTFMESDGFIEGAKNFARAPHKIAFELFAESIGSLGPSIPKSFLRAGAPVVTGMAAIGAGVGAFGGSGIGALPGAGVGVRASLRPAAAATMGAASGTLEFAGKFVEVLSEKGVNMYDPQSIQDAFSNKEWVDEASELAFRKGLPIALFDAASAGIAGKLTKVKPTTRLGRAGAFSRELGAQMALGAGGELAGQATAGEDLNAVSAMAEAIGEIAGGSIEVAVGGSKTIFSSFEDTSRSPLLKPPDPLAPLELPDSQALREMSDTDLVQLAVDQQIDLGKPSSELTEEEVSALRSSLIQESDLIRQGFDYFPQEMSVDPASVQVDESGTQTYSLGYEGSGNFPVQASVLGNTLTSLQVAEEVTTPEGETTFLPNPERVTRDAVMKVTLQGVSRVPASVSAQAGLTQRDMGDLGYALDPDTNEYTLQDPDLAGLQPEVDTPSPEAVDMVLGEKPEKSRVSVELADGTRVSGVVFSGQPQEQASEAAESTQPPEGTEALTEEGSQPAEASEASVSEEAQIETTADSITIVDADGMGLTRTIPKDSIRKMKISPTTPVGEDANSRDMEGLTPTQMNVENTNPPPNVDSRPRRTVMQAEQDTRRNPDDPGVRQRNFNKRVLENPEVDPYIAKKLPPSFYNQVGNDQTIAAAIQEIETRGVSQSLTYVRDNQDITAAPKVNAMTQLLITYLGEEAARFREDGQTDIADKLVNEQVALYKNLQRRGTLLGRAVQIFRSFLDLTREGKFEAMTAEFLDAQAVATGKDYKKLQASRALLEGTQDPASRKVGDVVATNPEVVERVSQEKEIMEAVEDATPQEDEPGVVDRLKDRIENYLKKPVPKEDDPVRRLLDDLFAVAKDRLPSRPKLPKPDNTRAFIKQALENLDDYREIYRTARDEVRDAIDANLAAFQESSDFNRQDLDVFFRNLLGYRMVTRRIPQLTRVGIREQQIRLQTLIRDWYTRQQEVTTTLSREVARSLGVSKPDADYIEGLVHAEMDRLTTRMKEKALLSQFGFNPNTTKVEDTPKKMQDFISKLVTATNLGALDSDTWGSAVSAKYDMPGLTGEFRKEIRDRIDQLQQIVEETGGQESIQAERATAELVKRITQEAGVSKGDVITALFYSNILSGVRTIFETNPLSTAMNALGDQFAKTAVLGLRSADRGAIPGLYSQFFAGFMKGVLQDAGRAIKYGEGVDKFGRKWNIPTPLESINFTGIPKALGFNGLKYVQRAMVAGDAIFWRAGAQAGAYYEAWNSARAEGFTGEDLRNEAALRLRINTKAAAEASSVVSSLWDQYNGDQTAIREALEEQDVSTPTGREIAIQREAAERQALEESESPVTGQFVYSPRDIERRTDQILENQWDAQYRQAAVNAGDHASFNYDPTGVMGMLSASVEQIVNGVKVLNVPVLKSVVPFSKIVANVTNHQLDWTPFGLLKNYTGTIQPGKGGTPSESVTLSPKAKEETAVKVATGSAVIALFLIDGEDDDSLIQVTARGPRDFPQQNQLRASGWRPYSIGIRQKDGTRKWIPYWQSPLALALGFIGSVKDRIRYQGEEFNDFADVAAVTMASMQTTLEQSFLANAADLISTITDRDADTATKGVQNFMGRASTSLIPYKNLIAQLNKAIDPMVRDTQRSTLKSIIREMPIIGNAVLGPKLDVLGNEVEADRPILDTFPPFGVPDPISDSESRTIYDWANEKGVWISMPNFAHSALLTSSDLSKAEKANPELVDRVQKDMTPNERDEYLKLRGRNLRRKLFQEERFGEFWDLPPGEGASKAFNKVLREAAREARREMAGLDPAKAVTPGRIIFIPAGNPPRRQRSQRSRGSRR